MTKTEQLRPRKQKTWFVVAWKERTTARSGNEYTKTVHAYVHAYWAQQAIDHVVARLLMTPSRLTASYGDSEVIRKARAGKLKGRTFDVDQIELFA